MPSRTLPFASVVLASCICAALIGCSSEVPAEGTTEKQSVATSVEEIRAMFAENQIGGAQYFETRQAVLTGEVVRVREVLGAGILVFKSEESGLETELAFTDEGTEMLGSLRAGNRVEATCPIVREALGQVIIGCTGITTLKTGETNGN